MVQLQWASCRAPVGSNVQRQRQRRKTSRNVSQRRVYVMFRPVLERQNGTKHNTMSSETYVSGRSGHFGTCNGSRNDSPWHCAHTATHSGSKLMPQEHHQCPSEPTARPATNDGPPKTLRYRSSAQRRSSSVRSVSVQEKAVRLRIEALHRIGHQPTENTQQTFRPSHNEEAKRL